jgi:cell division protein FtsB
MQQRRQPGGQGPLRGSRPGSRGGGVLGKADRSGARPATARRPAAQGAAKRTRAPGEHGLTGRAIAFLVVLAALALGYAYPVRVYLTQVAEIEATTEAQQEQRQRIEALEEEAAKWDDAQYVQIQLRKRFFWVKKGEIPLIPVWEGTLDTGKPPAESKPTNWYETLWSSVDAANG